MFFSSPPKLEFFNETPGVAEMMPLEPAKEYRHPWANRAMEDFAQIRKTTNWGHSKSMHTARCPGIFTLQRHGWIMRTWQDIVITTDVKDNVNFSWLCAHDQNGVGFHKPNQLADFWEKWPADTLRSVVKIHTGWRCNVPKGYYLLEMPLPLTEEQRFTTMPGYFSKEAGPASMNVQLLWHVLDGETLIKAGTPIAQYVLVPKEQPSIICRDAVPSDKLSLSALYDASRFVKNYREVKKLFSG